MRENPFCATSLQESSCLSDSPADLVSRRIVSNHPDDSSMSLVPPRNCLGIRYNDKQKRRRALSSSPNHRPLRTHLNLNSEYTDPREFSSRRCRRSQSMEFATAYRNHTRAILSLPQGLPIIVLPKTSQILVIPAFSGIQRARPSAILPITKIR